MDKLYSEQIEELNAEVDKVRSIAKDSVAAKEKELQDLMTTQINKLEQTVSENTEDMIKERKATLQKYSR